MSELMMELDFLPRFIVNTIFIIVLVRGCYFQHSKNRPFAASFILFGTGVFLVTGLLHSADISMGFAFGLFAVFSMLRYRTESITIKEMTYLFLVISIALITAVSPIGLLGISIINVIICIFAYILETGFLLPLTEEKIIKYEKIENIKPEGRVDLINDLKQRTGLEIKHLNIESIDFLNDTAQIRVFYKSKHST
ncbi:MAG: DUF4956 domain-containing protein [Arenicella sp.]|nr:DUF4956 domain-containing protein [Arenicella sp.]